MTEELITVLDMPTGLGSRFVMKLPKDFNRSDIKKVKKWFRHIIRNHVTIYEKQTK